jgi:hypothetical protein
VIESTSAESSVCDEKPPEKGYSVAPTGFAPSFLSMTLLATLVLFALIYPVQGNSPANVGQRKLLTFASEPEAATGSWYPFLAFIPLASLLLFKLL